ncbi:MAG: DUF1648 domain-containing protein [Coriobacteriia bacterium]|nr:DUF1648 domain-containing protein [Coriobacteriia bacterium]
MTASEIRQPDTITAKAAEQIDAYFARFKDALLAAGVSGAEEAISDLRDHVSEQLGGADTPEEIARVLAKLGTPEALAAEYAEAQQLAEAGAGGLSGRVLGMPYDVRVPNAERLAQRWWDPLDRRVLVPRIFGLGWTVNFGALAVLTGIVRPDDEEVPFGAVPSRLVSATLVLPLAIVAAFAVLVAVSWPSLPALVPSHWGVSGVDDYQGRGQAVVFLSLMAGVPLAFAFRTHLRRRSPLNRVVASAFSSVFAILALSVFAQTLFALSGGAGTWLIWVGIACSVLVPFALFVVMSRIGRAAEQRRDLSKGRVR